MPSLNIISLPYDCTEARIAYGGFDRDPIVDRWGSTKGARRVRVSALDSAAREALATDVGQSHQALLLYGCPPAGPERCTLRVIVRRNGRYYARLPSSLGLVDKQSIYSV